VVEQAQKVLEEAARIRDIAQAGRNQLAGVFHLGAILTVTPYLLPDLIPALNERADMPLEIEEHHRAAEVGSNRAASTRPSLPCIRRPASSPSFSTRSLSRWSCQRHPWAKQSIVRRASGEHTILLNVGHCFRDQVLDSCPELNRGAAVTRTNSLETIRNMVASGLGVSVLPRDLDAQVPQPARRPVPREAGAVATHRAGLREDLSRPEAVVAIRDAVAACRAGPATGRRPRHSRRDVRQATAWQRATRVCR
jgi:LysR family hydrogen peroxide-inducible transcriptional activator